MTTDEVRQSITGWGSAGDDLELTGERSEPDADLALGVRTGAAGGSPVEIQVVQARGADRITLRHTASASGRSAEAAQTLIDERPGWITGTVAKADTGTSVTLETFIYLDGFNRQSFMQAVAEMARTARLLGGLSTAAAAASSPASAVASTPLPSSSPAPAPSPMAASTPSASPSPSPAAMPQPSFTPQPQYQPQPQPQYSPQPQYQPQPQPQPAPQGPGGWAPSHTVPPQGLRAWAAPDPGGPVVANLAPGLPIQVAEVRGAWARVICSNGWTGWIDGRLIGVAA